MPGVPGWARFSPAMSTKAEDKDKLLADDDTAPSKAETSAETNEATGGEPSDGLASKAKGFFAQLGGGSSLAKVPGMPGALPESNLEDGTTGYVTHELRVALVRALGEEKAAQVSRILAQEELGSVNALAVLTEVEWQEVRARAGLNLGQVSRLKRALEEARLRADLVAPDSKGIPAQVAACCRRCTRPRDASKDPKAKAPLEEVGPPPMNDTTRSLMWCGR